MTRLLSYIRHKIITGLHLCHCLGTHVYDTHSEVSPRDSGSLSPWPESSPGFDYIMWCQILSSLMQSYPNSIVKKIKYLDQGSNDIYYFYYFLNIESFVKSFYFYVSSHPKINKLNLHTFQIPHFFLHLWTITGVPKGRAICPPPPLPW